jgi:hypothetical protein
MTLSAEKIDEIVRNVLRELEARRAAPVTAPVSASGKSTEKPASAEASPVVVIRGRVISEAVLAASGAAGKTVSLMRGAILTPSGRDYIRKYSVRLSSLLPQPEGSVGGLVLIAGKSPTTQSAAQAAGWKVAAVEEGIAAATAARAASAGQRVICVTEDPSIVACLLNRDSAVRAAVVAGQKGLEKLIRTMHPNVVCLASEGWSFNDLTRLLRLMTSVKGPAESWKEIVPGGTR